MAAEMTPLFARSVCFSLEKLGSAALEWEDAAACRDGDPMTGRRPRFVVVDGATEAYDSLRWVEQLVVSFVADGGNGSPAAPDLTPDAMRHWFGRMQRQWVEQAPTRFANVIEEYKFREEGSFATFLGCELTGMDGTEPRWEAVALGDTVLFHVRGGRLLAHFPPIAVEEFGLSPEGVSTRPAALEQIMRGLAFSGGPLRMGDLLFVATDAFAHWILTRLRGDQATLWAVLAELDHDATFAALVGDARADGQLRNDDVTLLRIQVVQAQPTCLVVCL